MAMTGGDLVARMLRAEGVEVVFGIVDGSYFGLTEGLRKVGIRLVSPRHETSGAHMAGAYARLTGKLGVCLASNGPGAGLYFEFLPYTQETGGFEKLGLWVCQNNPHNVAAQLRETIHSSRALENSLS